MGVETDFASNAIANKTSSIAPGIDLQVEVTYKQMKQLLFFVALTVGNLLAEISTPKNLRIVTAEPTPTPSPSDPQDIDLTGYKLVFEENFDVLSVVETDAKGDEKWYAYPPFGPAGAFSTSHFTPEAMQSIDGVLVNTASWDADRRDPLARTGRPVAWLAWTRRGPALLSDTVTGPLG